MTLIYRANDSRIDLGIVGGKAASLARLARHGFAVPHWICLTFDAFGAFVAPHRDLIAAVSGRLADADAGEIEDCSRRLRDRLGASPVDPAVAAAVAAAFAARDVPPDAGRPEARLVSVRSSAEQEDSAHQSFAGIFSTALNVPRAAVVDRVKECWLSAFSGSALKYLQKTSIPLDAVRMAVVIQDMVRADKSGVLFQANPAGQPGELVIVAGYGLGEGVVSGLVGTDTVFVDRSSGAARTDVGDKAERIDGAVEGGVETRPVPPHLRRRGILDDKELAALRRLDERIGACFPEVQDVEWCFDGRGALWLLQSRTITTLPPGPIRLFDNSNIVESYPGTSSHLTRSMVQDIYRRMFYEMFRHGGYPARVLDRYDDAFSTLVAPIQGRIYYNLSSWYRMMALFPAASRLFTPALEDSIGVERSVIREAPAGGAWRLVFGLGLIARFVLYRPVFARYRRRYARLLEATYAEIASARGDADLLAIHRSFYARVFDVEEFGRTSDAYLMAFLYAVRGLVRRRGLTEEDALELVNGVLVGEPDLESVKPVRSVRRLAARLAADAALLDALGRAATWDGARASLRAADPSLLDGFLHHLDVYGDRSIAELKLETATFREDPMGLVRVVVGHARAGAPNADSESREAALRGDAERRLFDLFGGLSRPPARYLVHKLRQFVRTREYTRLNRARYYGVIRAVFNRIAEDWTERKLIDAPGDVFELERGEIEAAIDGGAYGHLRGIVAARRGGREAERAMRPLNRMWLKGDVARNAIPQLPEPPDGAADGAAAGRVFTGLGCCPGSVTAEAVVLRSPSDSEDVAGKIIVAESTDPGWAFLIMKAAGLVMEKGSLLSHTAIIGREMGIPTVVGVRSATSVIPSGVDLALDGASGTVRVVAKRGERAAAAEAGRDRAVAGGGRP